MLNFYPEYCIPDISMNFKLLEFNFISQFFVIRVCVRACINRISWHYLFHNLSVAIHNKIFINKTLLSNI